MAGKKTPVKCENCGGEGAVICPVCNGKKMRPKCTSCDGCGAIQCMFCNGSGWRDLEDDLWEE